MKASGVVGVVLLLFGVITVLSTYYTVDQGDRAVVLHYGAFDSVSGPGLHFKVPFITSIESVSVRPFVVNYGGNTGLSASSKDQQVAQVWVSVNVHIAEKDVGDLYNEFTSADIARERMIDPKVLSQVRNVFGQYDAADAIQQRAKLSLEVEMAIKKAVVGPITIDSVQVEKIAFSADYNRAVEERMQAQVAAVKAEAQKQKTIIEADAAAYQVKAAADAQAHQIEVKGDAEAKAIRARAEALANNPQLVALTAVEKWNGALPTTMPPNGTVPFMPVVK